MKEGEKSENKKKKGTRFEALDRSGARERKSVLWGLLFIISIEGNITELRKQKGRFCGNVGLFESGSVKGGRL